MTLPTYVKCDNEKVLVCDFYLTGDCKNTCAYALSIGGTFIGSPVVPPHPNITKELSDQLFLEDMRDY